MRLLLLCVGRDGAEQSAHTAAPAVDFPHPPRLFIYLMLKAALYGSNSATDRCDINGLLCEACSFKCLLITRFRSGTTLPGFPTDKCSFVTPQTTFSNNRSLFCPYWGNIFRYWKQAGRRNKTWTHTKMLASFCFI